MKESGKRQLSPLQQKRNQCLGDLLRGRTYASREEQHAEFRRAHAECQRKFPKE